MKRNRAYGGPTINYTQINPTTVQGSIVHTQLLLLIYTPTYKSVHELIKILAAADKSLQSCPTLCNPIDGSPPGPAVPGIL